MITILVAETIPCQNKGEAALMHGIVKSIENFSNDKVKFYLCSETKELDEDEYSDNVVVLNNPGMIPSGEGSLRKLAIFSYRFFIHILFLICYKTFGKFSLILFRNQLWRAYHEADAIIVGHDNAFCKFHIPLLLYAKLMSKPVAVYGTTIMPTVLNSGLIRNMAKYALNKVNLITTRESLTYEHLKSIGVNKPPLYCTADKAFILEQINKDASNKLKKTLSISDLPKPHIGVMIVKGSTVYKAAFKNEKLAPDEKYDKHISEIASTFDKVTKNLGGTLIFVPHCIGPGNHLDDRICAKDVKEKMKNKENTKIVNDTLRVTELKGLLGTFDMVVTERTHGGINAASMLIPTLWITHPKDHRTYGIVTDTLNLPECIYNIENLNSNDLSEKILDTYSNRESIINKLKVHIPLAQEKTMSNGKYFINHVIR